MACDAYLRLNPPLTPAPAPTTAPTAVATSHTVTLAVGPGPDRRLPPPGTVLARPYKGGTVRVTVLATEFAFEGAAHGSLSAAARAATATHCNGFLFFRLHTKGAAARVDIGFEPDGRGHPFRTRRKNLVAGRTAAI